MILSFMVLACSSFSIDMDFVSEGEIEEWEENGYDPDIIFVEHSAEATASSFYRDQELNVLLSFDDIGLQALEVPKHINTLELIAYLRAQGRYNFVSPSLLRQLPTPIETTLLPNQSPSSTSRVQASSPVNDPYLSWQWHMDLMQVNDVSSDYWGKDATITVIDSGISVGNDGFNNLMPGGDFINDDDDPNDEGGHGTHVAGTIAQKTNNSYGVRGVAPDVTLYGVKVFSPSLVTDSNTGGFSVISYAQAFQFAVDNGSDVINLSLGSSSYSSWEESLINVALDAGIAVVAATGNDASSVGYPAALDGVVAIGSVANDSSWLLILIMVPR